MRAYKNDGSGAYDVFTESQHFRIYKGQVKALPPPSKNAELEVSQTSRPVEFRSIPSNSRARLKQKLEQ